MKYSALRKAAFACTACVTLTTPAFASDACSTVSVTTAANVTVSDGKTYTARSHFQTKDTAALSIIDDAESFHAVEGPNAWIRNADGETLAPEATKSFALGHQFHALLLRFEDIVSNIEPFENIDFNGGPGGGEKGDLPFGGVVMRFAGEDGAFQGLRFLFPETAPIDVTFHDWRRTNKLMAPFHIRIDDQQRVFDYRYTDVAIKDRAPTWFFDKIDAPDLAPVQIHRLHRKLLAAHCLGDAGMMGDLTAPEITVVSRGGLFASSDRETRERFKEVFGRSDYQRYVDLKSPVIEVAESGDIGWAAVNVLAAGEDKESGAPFEMEWAWVMLVRKIDGVWLNAGNASNMKPQ